MSKKGYVPLAREPPQVVSIKEFIETEEALFEMWLKKIAIIFLFVIYAGALAATFLLFFCQGFRWYGFNLNSTVLSRLGIATIGEVAGLALLVYGSLFRRR